MNDVYVQDGVVYPDEATAVVAMHPNIPEELKRVFITKPDEKPSTRDENVYEPPATLDENILTPRGLEGNRQFQQDPELETPIVYPTPDYLNPPEKGPGFEGPPRPEPKVLFKTASPLVNITDQDIDNAIQITTSFGSGTMAGVKAAKNLGKINDLGQATIMEHQGAHPDQTLHDTGWYRDVDNRWKFELDDSKAKFNREWFDKPFVTSRKPEDPIGRNEGLTTAKLPEVLDHPELYKAYPHLRNVDVVRDPRVETAHWDETNNLIAVGPEQFNDKSTFLHEVQHAVQSHENFARGAAPGKAGANYDLKYTEAFEEYKKEAVKHWDEINQKYKEKGAMGLSNEDMDFIAKDRLIRDKYSAYVESGDAQAYENYMNAAGEVEARNTEARMLMTVQERRQTHPYYTAETDEPIINFKARATTPYDRRRQ